LSFHISHRFLHSFPTRRSSDLIQHFDTVTKGAAGIYVTYKKPDFWALTFENDIPFYYIALVIMLLMVLVTYLFTKSKTGYYLSRSEEHTSELQSRFDLVCRLLL